ncbi:hypothetical protein ACFSCZ_13815 [Siminovitchia sediminis]|uniref:Uncharacterized protein n=1 Tax=Siminovitchia sediminis TaxID=1274353 RepID=A0ABW4KIP2_9BACI
MDKLSKRVMYNPDGSSVIRRWDNSIIVKGKQDSAFESNHSKAMDRNEFTSMTVLYTDDLEEFEDRYLDEPVNNWETEVDYY